MPKLRYGALAPVVLLALLATSSLAGTPRKIPVDGLSLTYVEEGSGPLLVLVHGSISDYREWSNQMVPFARHYRVIAYSRRYHWPNLPPGTDADASVERQADDLAALIQAMGRAPHMSWAIRLEVRSPSTSRFGALSWCAHSCSPSQRSQVCSGMGPRTTRCQRNLSRSARR